MDILKQLASQAEQAEVIQVRKEATRITFEAGRLKSSQVEETAGMAVRVVKSGRIGFAASTDAAAQDKVVANALESAAYGEAVPITFPAAQPAPKVTTYDQRIADLPVSRMVEIGRQIVELLRQAEPEAQIDVHIERSVQEDSLRNHAGANCRIKRSPLSILAGLQRIKGDDVLILYDMLGLTVWDDDYLAPARRIAEKLERAKTIVPLRSGKMPVLFSPDGLLALGMPLMAGLDGKNVYKRTSPLIGKVGEKLFDEKLGVVDDATLDGRFGSAPYDDEGVPHRRTALIEGGVLKSFIYDLKTAALSGVPSTGNGGRSLFAPPQPEPSNLIFSCGRTPLAEMIAGIQEGLVVEDVLGLGQGNIVSGAFSNPLALGFKIERGQIVGRVKDVSIAGNIYELLKDVAAVSRESEWVYASYRLPYLLLPEMNVVSKS